MSHNEPKKYALELDERSISIIGEALLDMPAKVSMELILEINRQLEPQTKSQVKSHE